MPLGAIAALYASCAWAAVGDILERTMILTDMGAPFVAERVIHDTDGLRIVDFLPAAAIRQRYAVTAARDCPL